MARKPSQDPDQKVVETTVKVLADGSIGHDPIEVSPPVANEYLESIQFMEEPVTIVIEESNHPNDENPVRVGCNGPAVTIQRGVPTTIKRKFLNNLLVKTTAITTPEITGPNGDRTRQIRRHSSLRYPISVLKDTDRGRAWYEARKAEAV